MPAQNTFSGTGIVDGQIVEAPHVSQSVDAFTAQKDYDIVLSGSLEVTGSVNISGSLINEFTGQFKTLGIGTTAPLSPTMLHVKSNAAGGFDPIVLIEGKAGGDDARLRLKQPDIEFDLGAYGSFSDDFRLVQDQSGLSPKYPFIINKDTEDYTLYVSGDSVGVGLGASSPSILQALPAGSFQSLNMISGSLLRATEISASGAGINIHGTASYANYVETAQTASYVKATGIDFFYSISQQINHDGTIAAQTGSFNHLKVDSQSGIALRNVTDGNYTRFISGSTEADEGSLFIGNAPGGTMMEISNAQDFVKIYASNTFIKGDAVVADDLFISGSVTPTIIVGPTGAPGSNNASASLQANDLQFNRNNTAYIGNYNTDSTSRLQLSAGGGGSNATMALEVSASRDVKLSGSLNILGTVPTAVNDLQAFWNQGTVEYGTGYTAGNSRNGYYQMKPFNSTSSALVQAFRFGKISGVSNVSVTSTQIICAAFKVCAIGNPSNGNGVYLERTFLARWSGTAWSILGSGTEYRNNSNSVYNSSTITATVTNSGTTNCVNINITPNTTTDTDWVGWIDIKWQGNETTL